MDINDLKIKEVRQILSAFRGANLHTTSEPFIIGKCYRFTIAGRPIVGEVVNIKGHFIILNKVVIGTNPAVDNIINMHSIESARLVDCAALNMSPPPTLKPSRKPEDTPNLVLKEKE